MTFRPGQSGNPAGKPKGARNKDSRAAVKELWNAIRYVQGAKDPETKKKRHKLMVHYVEQAYSNPKVLMHLMERILPALKSVDFEGKVDSSFTGRVLVIETIPPGKDKNANGAAIEAGQADLPPWTNSE